MTSVYVLRGRVHRITSTVALTCTGGSHLVQERPLVEEVALRRVACPQLGPDVHDLLQPGRQPGEACRVGPGRLADREGGNRTGRNGHGPRAPGGGGGGGGGEAARCARSEMPTGPAAGPPRSAARRDLAAAQPLVPSPFLRLKHALSLVPTSSCCLSQYTRAFPGHPSLRRA